MNEIVPMEEDDALELHIETTEVNRRTTHHGGLGQISNGADTDKQEDAKSNLTSVQSDSISGGAPHIAFTTTFSGATFGLAPWLAKTRAKSGTSSPPESNVMRALGKEIEALVEYLAPSEHEQIIREWLIGRLRDAVRKLFGKPPSIQAALDHLQGCYQPSSDSKPWGDIVPVGSFTTGLYLPTGDIDVTVVLYQYDHLSKREIIDKVVKMLREEGFAEGKNILPVSSARVPIIKFTDKRSTLSVDMSFEKVSGVESSDILKESLSDERNGAALRVLIVFLKYFLMQRGLHEPFMGGLGSYALSLLVISFLQLHPLLHQYKELNPLNCLGPLTLDFLNLHGKLFIYERYGIDLREGGGYFIRAESDTGHVCLRDPQDARNNVAKNTFRLSEVKHAFYDADQRLRPVIERYAKNPSHDISLLQPLISILRINQRRKHLTKMWSNMVRSKTPQIQLHPRDHFFWDLGRGLDIKHPPRYLGPSFGRSYVPEYKVQRSRPNERPRDREFRRDAPFPQKSPYDYPRRRRDSDKQSRERREFFTERK